MRVVQGDILLRGEPDAALVQSMREAKPALVRLLTGRDCYRCGAAREPLRSAAGTCSAGAATGASRRQAYCRSAGRR